MVGFSHAVGLGFRPPFSAAPQRGQTMSQNFFPSPEPPGDRRAGRLTVRRNAWPAPVSLMQWQWTITDLNQALGAVAISRTTCAEHIGEEEKRRAHAARITPVSACRGAVPSGLRGTWNSTSLPRCAGNRTRRQSLRGQQYLLPGHRRRHRHMITARPHVELGLLRYWRIIAAAGDSAARKPLAVLERRQPGSWASGWASRR